VAAGAPAVDAEANGSWRAAGSGASALARVRAALGLGTANSGGSDSTRHSALRLL
jgi:hypothetical protein